MDRQIVYPGAIPLETDLLNTNRNTMVGLAKLAAAVLGTSTFVNGLAVTPTAPASMSINVAAGEIYALANLDGTAYSSLAADTTHSILKQGIALDGQALALTAPGTAGYSVNYLIQASYQDADANAVAIPYYNSANPSQAWSGPGNSGAQQSTLRKGTVVVSAKTGIAATTGTQATPAADSGYVGLYVVTVANGQSTITAPNISTYAGAPFLPAGGLVVGGIQNNLCNSSVAGGTADALTGSYFPGITALPAAGAGVLTLYLRAASANATTTPTFTPASGVIAAKTIVKGNGLALAAGDIAGGGHWIELQYDATLDKWVLLNPAFGVSAAPSVVGAVRNAKMSVTAASASATFTADEVVVESSLGGAAYKLASFNKTINLATTGAGGMDTGSAPTSGYVALYAIYNPTSGASALLAANATSAAAPNVYGGANMPAGYTASALVSVWTTNASGQLVVGYQNDRTLAIPAVSVLNTSTQAPSQTALSITGAVPLNAKAIQGYVVGQSTSVSNITITLFPHPSVTGGSQITTWGGSPAGVQQQSGFSSLQIANPGQIGYTALASAGTPTFQILINGYAF